MVLALLGTAVGATGEEGVPCSAFFEASFPGGQPEARNRVGDSDLRQGHGAEALYLGVRRTAKLPPPPLFTLMYTRYVVLVGTPGACGSLKPRTRCVDRPHCCYAVAGTFLPVLSETCLVVECSIHCTPKLSRVILLVCVPVRAYPSPVPHPIRFLNQT